MTTDWPVLPQLLKDYNMQTGTGTIASGSTVQFVDSNNNPTPYIANGTFVSGNLATGGITVTISLVFDGVPLSLSINHAVITFDHTAPNTAANGTIAGVINTNDLINGLKAVAGRISTSLCGGAFDGIAQQIMQASDIIHDGTNVMGTACDGISVGLGFTGALIANPDTVSMSDGGVPPDPCTMPMNDGGNPNDSGNNGNDSSTDVLTGCVTCKIVQRRHGKASARAGAFSHLGTSLQRRVPSVTRRRPRLRGRGSARGLHDARRRPHGRVQPSTREGRAPPVSLAVAVRRPRGGREAHRRARRRRRERPHDGRRRRRRLPRRLPSPAPRGAATRLRAPPRVPRARRAARVQARVPLHALSGSTWSRPRVLASLESSSQGLLRGGFDGLKSLVFMGYYRDARTWKIVGYAGPFVGRSQAT